MVALGPGVPLQLQGVAGLDGDGGASRFGRLVAGDVAGAELAWLNEASGRCQSNALVSRKELN